MRLKKRKFFETVECYIDGKDPSMPTGYVVLEKSGLEVSMAGEAWSSNLSTWFLKGKRLRPDEDGTFLDGENRRLIPAGHVRFPRFC